MKSFRKCVGISGSLLRLWPPRANDSDTTAKEINQNQKTTSILVSLSYEDEASSRGLCARNERVSITTIGGPVGLAATYSSIRTVRQHLSRLIGSTASQLLPQLQVSEMRKAILTLMAIASLGIANTFSVGSVGCGCKES
jgi:hypothetical protein